MDYKSPYRSPPRTPFERIFYQATRGVSPRSLQGVYDSLNGYMPNVPVGSPIRLFPEAIKRAQSLAALPRLWGQNAALLGLYGLQYGAQKIKDWMGFFVFTVI